jgi:hypothetical protein
LELHQRNYQEHNGICHLCGQVQMNQQHMINQCRVIENLWDCIFSMLFDLIPFGTNIEEMSFGLEGKRAVVNLRNYITFTLRSSIHKHRNLDFNDPGTAEQTIFMAFKKCLKDDMKIKFLTAQANGTLKRFTDTFLIKNILGEIRDDKITFQNLLDE